MKPIRETFFQARLNIEFLEPSTELLIEHAGYDNDDGDDDEALQARTLCI